MLCKISLVYLICFCIHSDILIYIGFCKGCDASILLDESPNKKVVTFNLNSTRGFNVVD